MTYTTLSKEQREELWQLLDAAVALPWKVGSWKVKIQIAGGEGGLYRCIRG